MLLKSLAIAAVAAVTATAASAVTFVSAPASTGELVSPGSSTVDFTAPGGAAVTDFVIQGFGTLDGVNAFQDTFTLNLNGTDVFSGSFNLGGGGSDMVFLAAPGATYSPANVVFDNGGEVTIHTPLTLATGVNTLTFSYAGPAQGLSDEAWGIRALTVTGAVPEPAAWALLVIGFVFVGTAARRRSDAVTA